MSDEVTRLAARVDAVERALSDGETGLDRIEDLAALDARLSELESTADALESRVAELEAAVEAVRGFAGGIRAANLEVERRADLALAKAEALEADRRDDDGTARPTGDSTGTRGESPGGSAGDANGRPESEATGRPESEASGRLNGKASGRPADATDRPVDGDGRLARDGGERRPNCDQRRCSRATGLQSGAVSVTDVERPGVESPDVERPGVEPSSVESGGSGGQSRSGDCRRDGPGLAERLRDLL